MVCPGTIPQKQGARQPTGTWRRALTTSSARGGSKVTGGVRVKEGIGLGLGEGDWVAVKPCVVVGVPELSFEVAVKIASGVLFRFSLGVEPRDEQPPRRTATIIKRYKRSAGIILDSFM